MHESCPQCVALEAENTYLRSFLSSKERTAMDRGGTVSAHRDDPWTSKFSAHMLSGPRRWDNRLRVLRCVVLATGHPFTYEHPKDGRIEVEYLTDDEMTRLASPHGLGLTADGAYSTFRTCRTELSNLLLVRNSGVTRNSWSMSNRGSRSTAWASVPGAIERFSLLRNESEGLVKMDRGSAEEAATVLAGYLR